MIKLPFIGNHTGRSAMAYEFKCGNACNHPVPNQSTNEYIGDIVNLEVSRRAWSGRARSAR